MMNGKYARYSINYDVYKKAKKAHTRPIIPLGRMLQKRKLAYLRNRSTDNMFRLYSPHTNCDSRERIQTRT